MPESDLGEHLSNRHHLTPRSQILTSNGANRSKPSLVRPIPAKCWATPLRSSGPFLRPTPIDPQYDLPGATPPDVPSPNWRPRMSGEMSADMRLSISVSSCCRHRWHEIDRNQAKGVPFRREYVRRTYLRSKSPAFLPNAHFSWPTPARFRSSLHTRPRANICGRIEASSIEVAQT